MNRFLRVVFALVCFEIGAALILLPWWPPGAWERNYFLSRYPELIPYLLHPSVRGIISGLGILDIAVAASMLRRRSPATVVH